MTRRVKALLDAPRATRPRAREAASPAHRGDRAPARQPHTAEGGRAIVDARPVVQRQSALGAAISASPRQAGSTPGTAPGGVVQRQIDARAPTRGYRKANGSNSARLNSAIDAYNALLGTGASLEDKLAALQLVRDRMALISAKKHAFRDQLRAIVDREEHILRAEDRAVHDVMTLARQRAALQDQHALPAQPHEVPPQLALNGLEALHALDPRKILHGGESVGDALAKSREIKNVHQTGHSSVGSNTDSAKRKTAEIGSFYPERYRRDSFSRTAHQNPSATKGLVPELLPPDQALPKYAALNLTGSPMGAIESVGDREAFPLHLAIRPSVLAARATMTSSDSLRAWTPFESDNSALKSMGAIQDEKRQRLPRDDQPWETAPTATFGGESTSHVLRAATGGRTPARNPDSYIEVQVHGQLRLDRDIEHVRANFFALFGEPRFAALYRTLCEAGITIHWYFRNDEDKVAEGNLITQLAGQDARYAPAWDHAARIRADSDDAIRAGAKRKGKEADEIEEMMGSVKSINMVTDEARGALKQLWDSLKG